ncbi:MAG: TetR/AcrR family transcriptional regulator [Chloroflexota bacterium]
MLQSDSKRGRSHNAEGAREAILDAAERVFAEHGFDGARIDTIAAEAGYNKSLIFQYFGDKLNLYAGVIRRADAQIRGFQNLVLAELFNGETVGDIERLKTMLRTFVSAYFDYLVAHPNFVRILNWEMAEGWQTYAQLSTERDLEEVVALSSPLQALADSGLLRSRFNPMGQMMLVMFTSQLYLGLLPLFNIYLPNVDSQSADGLARAREFIVEFITHGLIGDSGAADPSV